MNQYGNTVRRNRLHLIPTEEKFTSERDDGYEEVIKQDNNSNVNSQSTINQQPSILDERATVSLPLDLKVSNEPLLNKPEMESLRKTRSGRSIRKPHLDDYA